MAKTINGEAHLHALVDGKEIIIIKSSIRRDLRLADEEGNDWLPNSTIFEQLTLMVVVNFNIVINNIVVIVVIEIVVVVIELVVVINRIITIIEIDEEIVVIEVINEEIVVEVQDVVCEGVVDFVGNMFYLTNYEKIDGGHVAFRENPKGEKITGKAKKNVRLMMEKLFIMELELMLPKRKDTQVPQPSDPIENISDEVFHKELGDRLVRAATTASSLEAEQNSGNINKTQSKEIPNESSSLGPNSGGGSCDKDSLKHDELMTLCTTLQNSVLDLEKTTTTQHNEIASLKRRVKKLEKKNRSRTYRLKRLYKVGLTARVNTFGNKESLGKDASKQGRIDVIDVDKEITLEVFVAEHEVVVKGVNNEVNAVKEVVKVINTTKIIIDDAQVSAAGDKVSAASAATTTTATISTVGDITLA
nr:hypothetical protein [Tanacetum cinerariifolium]